MPPTNDQSRGASVGQSSSSLAQHSLWARQASANLSFRGNSNRESEYISALLEFEKHVHVSVFQRESADKYAAQGGTTGATWSAGERLASPPMRTLRNLYIALRF